MARCVTVCSYAVNSNIAETVLKIDFIIRSKMFEPSLLTDFSQTFNIILWMAVFYFAKNKFALFSGNCPTGIRFSHHRRGSS